MRSPASDADADWRLARWLAVLVVVGIAVWLTPPGRLPYPPNSAYSDAALAHWPNAFFLRQSLWRHGQWPLWNPTRMLGQPFAANPLSKVWYPPQWLVLLLPPTLHLDVMIYLHMAWSGLGMLAWARASKLNRMAGVAAALGWTLLPKAIAHLGAGHLDILYALAWTPWLLWAVRRLACAPPAPRGIAAGAIGALLVLADVRVAFYMLPVAALYGLVMALEPHADQAPRQPLWPWIAALGCLLLLIAVQVVPVIALSPYLTRSALTPREAAAYSLAPRDLLGAVIANVGGFHETMTYLGITTLALALIALRRREDRRVLVAFGLMTMLAILWALGESGPLFLPLVERVPFLARLRVPSRAWFVTALGVIVLAAFGLDTLLRRPLGGRGRLAGAAAAFAGLVWVTWTLARFASLPERGRASLLGVGAALLGTGLGVWMAGGGADSLWRGRASSTRRAGGGALVATLLLSYLLLDRTLIEGRPIDWGQAVDAALIAEMNVNCERVYSASFDLVGPMAAQAGVRTLHGVDPFQLRASADAIAAAAGVQTAGYSITAPPLPESDRATAYALADARPDTDALAVLGVRWVTARFPIESDGLAPNAQADDAILYELADVPSPAALPCAGGPNRVTMPLDSVPAGAIAVVPQAWAPGWRIRIDGRAVPVQRVDGVFLGAEVPPGARRLEAVYRPTADFVGLAISGSAALVLGGWWIAQRRGSARES